MVRRAILKLNADLLAQFLRDGTGLVEVVENPLPPDARIVHARMYILEPGVILLHIESESFAPVKEGDVYPLLPSPVFRRVDDAPR